MCQRYTAAAHVPGVGQEEDSSSSTSWDWNAHCEVYSGAQQVRHLGLRHPLRLCMERRALAVDVLDQTCLPRSTTCKAAGWMDPAALQKLEQDKQYRFVFVWINGPVANLLGMNS